MNQQELKEWQKQNERNAKREALGKSKIDFEASRKGGLATTEKKTKAARSNGTKGGRPRSTEPSPKALYMRQLREQKLKRPKE